MLRVVSSGLHVADGGTLSELTRRYCQVTGFTGEVGTACVAPGPSGEPQLLVGCGPRAELGRADVTAAVAVALRRAGPGPVIIQEEWVSQILGAGRAGEAIALGAQLGGYSCRPGLPDADGSRVRDPRQLVIVGFDDGPLGRGVTWGTSLGRAQNLVRDLVNEPAATMTPARLAQVAQEVAQQVGLEVEVWGPELLSAKRMGGLAAVGRGSHQDSCLVRLRYRGTREESAERPLALVGKGVTFDSGGLSLKAAERMETMKLDMCGAATIVGLMSVLPDAGVRGEVTAYLPLCENMPGGGATRPGDVVAMADGTTVEIVNTDAEGRLILADCLAVARSEGAGRIIDLASLTGACRVALGPRVGGLFANDDTLAGQVQDAATRAGEQFWRLPLHEPYRAELATHVADMRNVGRPRRPQEAGAIVAALFLSHFAGPCPWVHLDMGGPAYQEGDSPEMAAGATGFGMRTLVEFALADPSRPDAD